MAALTAALYRLSHVANPMLRPMLDAQSLFSSAHMGTRMRLCRLSEQSVVDRWGLWERGRRGGVEADSGEV